MAKHPMPDRPGYYWAKWQIAADGTHEGDDLTPADDFEIVQVNANVLGWDEIKPGEAGYDERLSVFVPGVRETQWPMDFIWGERVSDLRSNI